MAFLFAEYLLTILALTKIEGIINKYGNSLKNAYNPRM